MVKIAEIKSLIAVNKDDYTACIDSIEHSDAVSSLNAKLRFHHLKFDGNGRPMVSFSWAFI